jgi:hypothetical protein
MKFRVIVAGLLATAISAPMQAQSSACPSGTTQDACVKAVDLLNFMTPQLSTALVGGNPTLGQGGTLGGLGHFSIDIRASGFSADLPQGNGVGLSVAGKQSSNISTKSQLFGVPSVDAGIGLFRGFSLGVTHVGGVDAIVTMTYLPNLSSSSTGDVSINVNGSNEKFGYGVRVGLLEESAVTPGVSVVFTQRDLPSISLSDAITASSSFGSASGTIALNDFQVKTQALRITAAKSFLIFGISAGLGQDKYDANSSIVTTVSGSAASAPVAQNFSMTRMNYFVGAYVNLFIFKLEGEYGSVSGGTASGYNSFNGSTNYGSSRSYFTAGLRFGWGK